MLYLVRHAMPAIDPDVDPARWELNTDGRRAAEALSTQLPASPVLVASHEPKARQTLEPAGQVLTDARFNEVSRDEPFAGDFRTRRRAYVTGTSHPGWEPHRQVAARFHAGLQHWRAQAGTRPLVIATHGMAMTLWLTHTLGIPHPGAFWEDLRLPDLFEVDTTTNTLRRPIRA